MSAATASWRIVWRKGFSPLLPLRGLVALRKALIDDDPRLLQGATTSPPPLRCTEDWPVEAADVIAFCAWMNGDDTVGVAEEFFARACFEVDQRLGDPAGCRWFLNWFDETPRDEMRRLLLPEVELAILQKSEYRHQDDIANDLIAGVIAAPGDMASLAVLADRLEEIGDGRHADVRAGLLGALVDEPKALSEEGK